MTPFSKLLTHLINEKELSVYALAKSTGIERSYLQRMKTGTRLPTDETIVKSLAEAMMLTPAEKGRFLDAYYKTQMGEKKYCQRKLVKGIISNFYTQQPNDACIRTSFDTAIHLDGHYTIVNGQPQVNHMIQAMLEIEASRQNGRIRILAQPSFQWLIDAISTLNLSRNHTTLEHILYFDKENWEGQFYNLEMFQKLVPLLFVQENYIPYYTHEYVASIYNPSSTFPYLILTSGYAMHLSYDTKQALIYDLPDIIALMQDIFDKKLAQADRLFQAITAMPEEYFHTITSFINFDTYNMNVMYQPSLVPFCPPEVLAQAIDESSFPENHDKMVQEIMSFFAGMRRYAPLLVQNFTLPGLGQFMEEGYGIEIPRFMMKEPFPPASRLKILREFIRRVRNEQVPAHIVKSELFHIPPQMRLTTYTPRDIIMRYDRKDGHIFLLQPKEMSLVSAFRDFLNWLPESHLVYTREETLALLEKCYKEYTEKFKIPLPLL